MSETTSLPTRLVRVGVGAGAAAAAAVAAGAVAAVVAVVMAVVMAHRCRRLTVRGASMAPALLAGDRVLVVPARRLGAGDIVALPDPRQPGRLLVKRVAAVDSDRGMLSLLGDNSGASTDSRTFGPVPRHAVIGRVAFRYAPAERAGPVAGRPALTAMGRSPR